MAGGASRYRDGSFKTYFLMHGLADYRVFSFAQDARGAMWMGTLAGASRLDASSGKFTTYAKELVNEWVYGLAVDPKGQVVRHRGRRRCSTARLRRVDPGRRPGAPRTERGNYILAVHAAKTARSGRHLGGARGALRRRALDEPHLQGRLAGNIVYSIAQEADGTLWFGTDAGLSWYDGKKLRSLGPKGGPAGAERVCAAAAPKGEVWAGTRGGAPSRGAKGDGMK